MSAHVQGAEAGAGSSRRANRQRLLDAIRRLGPMSRADLAKTTRLSPPTVSALVEGLVGENRLLREVGPGVSSGGRPPILLAFNADFGTVVGVDIGSRTMRFAVADLQGRVLLRRHQRTRADSHAAAIDQLLTGIGAVLAETRRDPATVFAIAIGAPGTTDVASGRVKSAINLSGWVDVPLRDLVAARFAVPVDIDSAANMAALGERWQGAARDVRDFVFLSLGAGLGAGVIIDGRLHRGHRFGAGDIRRMVLDYREWETDFGPRGYLETRIGAAAIPRWAQARPLVSQTGNDPESALRVIFDLARNGDVDATAVLDELGVFLGSAVANLAAVLDPQLVVFGGGLSRAGDLLVDRVRRVVSRIVPDAPELAVSALEDDAQLLGSVYTAMMSADARLLTLAGTTAATPVRAAEG